jgi:serine/threonine protein phosphatase 1
MGRKFVCGDIHGANRALVQVLERSGFDFENDTLIQLGDVADGWPEVAQCVDTLLRIKNLISIKGNHDEWFLEWLTRGEHPCSWLQGGEGTLRSYCERVDKPFWTKMGGYVSQLTVFDIPLAHKDFWLNQQLYVIDEDMNLFVHGGFNRHHTLEENKKGFPEIFYWDRDLWLAALSYESSEKKYPFKTKDKFKEIFIGHTPTINWREGSVPISVPMHAANIWNMDTGGGFKGKISMMDIDTKEIFQSDFAHELYVGERGRT